MIFDGQLIDAGKFKKQLLSLSQGDLCADCLIEVLNQLEYAIQIYRCENCGCAKESIINFDDHLNCPMWKAAGINPNGYCHMWTPKED